MVKRYCREMDFRAGRFPTASLSLDKLVWRSFEGAAGGGTPEDAFLDLFCQGEVLVGNASGGVGLELDPELAPGDGEIGVVPGGFAQVADGVCEHQRGGPAVGVVLAAEPAVFQIPVCQ